MRFSLIFVASLLKPQPLAFSSWALAGSSSLQGKLSLGLPLSAQVGFAAFTTISKLWDMLPGAGRTVIQAEVMDYPKPDRSDLKPNFSKRPENEVLDLGWQEGVLHDGRPFRGEFWCQDQISMVTFFFSTIGLENASKQELEQLLVSENLMQFKPGQSRVEARKVLDASANEMWSVNVMIGDEDSTFVEGGRPFQPYPR